MHANAEFVSFYIFTTLFIARCKWKIASGENIEFHVHSGKGRSKDSLGFLETLFSMVNCTKAKA